MKINILVDNDKCWNLNIVKLLIPYLEKNNIKVDHIWILPNKLSDMKGNKISIWYFKTFGFYVFFKLSIFYLLTLVFNFFNKINNFKDLALNYDIKYNYIKTLTGKGSCIFLHLTKNYKPTAGCIALKKKDFLIMLRLINKKTKIRIF